MPAASGVFKQLAYKVESVYGTAPAASGAQSLRRVTSDINLTKDTYQSNEIRTDQQMQDMRHGVRRVQGTINGELSPGTYADFMGAALRKDFVAVSAVTGLSLTIAGAGPYTITRASGDFLTSGIKKGDVVRITAGSVNASNLNKNFLVTGVTATVLTVRVLNGTAMVAEGPIASCTITMPGKKTWAPTSGHTNKSYSIEHYYSDPGFTQSEVYTGCQPTTLDFQLPASGLATVGIGITGQGVNPASSQYFTSPTAASTTGLIAAVNGVVLLGGTAVAVLTGLTINVQSNRTGDPVVGSNVVPTLFPGRILASGQATAYFDSITLRDNFLNETEFEILLALTADNTATANFISFAMPRVKANGHTLSDGEGGLIATIPFQALLPTTGGSGVANELTTIAIHDSSAA
jgi:hypothetical protein